MLPILLFLVGSLLSLQLLSYGDEILFFNNWRIPPINTIFKIITFLGDGWMFAILSVGLLFFQKKWAFLIAFAGLQTMPIAYFLKDKIATDRPMTYFEKQEKTEVITFVPGVHLATGQTSFPSGHTTAAFVLYSLAVGFLPKRYDKYGIILAFIAMLVGVSRIFLVQHFLKDVIGGAVLGMLIAAFSLVIFQKIYRKNSDSIQLP